MMILNSLLCKLTNYPTNCKVKVLKAISFRWSLFSPTRMLLHFFRTLDLHSDTLIWGQQWRFYIQSGSLILTDLVNFLCWLCRILIINLLFLVSISPTFYCSFFIQKCFAQLLWPYSFSFYSFWQKSRS